MWSVPYQKTECPASLSAARLPDRLPYDRTARRRAGGTPEQLSALGMPVRQNDRAVFPAFKQGSFDSDAVCVNPPGIHFRREQRSAESHQFRRQAVLIGLKFRLPVMFHGFQKNRTAAPGGSCSGQKSEMNPGAFADLAFDSGGCAVFPRSQNPVSVFSLQFFTGDETIQRFPGNRCPDVRTRICEKEPDRIRRNSFPAKSLSCLTPLHSDRFADGAAD